MKTKEETGTFSATGNHDIPNVAFLIETLHCSSSYWNAGKHPSDSSCCCEFHFAALVAGLSFSHPAPCPHASPEPLESL